MPIYGERAYEGKLDSSYFAQDHHDAQEENRSGWHTRSYRRCDGTWRAATRIDLRR